MSKIKAALKDMDRATAKRCMCHRCVQCRLILKYVAWLQDLREVTPAKLWEEFDKQ